MRAAAVESKSLAKVGYDAARRVLLAEFNTGLAYRYFDVPVDVYEALMAAESKGRYFNEFVRGTV